MLPWSCFPSRRPVNRPVFPSKGRRESGLRNTISGVTDGPVYNLNEEGGDGEGVDPETLSLLSYTLVVWGTGTPITRRDPN